MSIESARERPQESMDDERLFGPKVDADGGGKEMSAATANNDKVATDVPAAARHSTGNLLINLQASSHR